jgi:hypothetical protein
VKTDRPARSLLGSLAGWLARSLAPQLSRAFQPSTTTINQANAMNLSYLQRLDPSTSSIVATAGHVALYDFDPSAKAWSRKEVEGSLFLVRTRDGRFRFVILNKKGDSGDYWEDLGEGFSCEKQEPYVMYKQERSGGQVVGIWFYEEQDCGRFAGLFEEIAGVLKHTGVAQVNQFNQFNQASPPASGQALLGMLKTHGVAPNNPSMPPPAVAPMMGGSEDVRRARALLEGLGRNELFCRILGDEMRRAGWG